MGRHLFYQLFVDLLRDMYDGENQIIDSLPGVIKYASHEDLRLALTNHLEETKKQLQRLKSIFKQLNENPTGLECRVMKSLFEDGKVWLSRDAMPATKDAFLIIACQKVEHYEIASYGSLCALAYCLRDLQKDKRIDFDEIIELLQQSLEEEKGADEKLTHLAEGGFFTLGINLEARKEDLEIAPEAQKGS